MAESSWQPVMGAAQRRRQRRLRSWWRHEQQSIAAALATVMHHSSGKVHTANGAPRSQKLATRAEEEVEYEPHSALRGQKTPPPGERPAPLSEVAGPQRSDRTVRHSAGEAPLLVVPSLRGADGVDGTTVSFLLAENLKLQKEEEEKERRRKREEAQHEARMRELDRRVMADEQLNPAESNAWRKWRGFLPSEPRREKKRKKKKLPRCPRPRQGCRRLCDHQRQVPVVRFPVMMQRQVPTVYLSCSLCSSWTWFLTCPLWYYDRCFSRWCRKLWLSRSCSPSTVVDIPFVPQRQNLMVQTIQRIIEIPQLPLVFRWSMSLLCWSCRFSGAAVAFLLVGRPSCSASWPVRLHRTVMPRHSCAWLVLQVTTQLALCRSDVYGGFWKNLLFFLREREPRSRGRFSPWKSGHYFHKQYLAVHTSATEAFGGISGVFLSTFGLVPARFAQGNLDIILMSFLMTSEGGFCRILLHFLHSVRMDMSAHFSALDDEEFFVVEGSGWRGRRESDSQVFCHPN